MADTNDLKRAQKVFETLCKTMDSQDWNYEKNEQELSIESGAQGEDLPIEFSVNVDAERKLVMFLSHIPYVIAEEKRLDLALAINIVNNKIVDGCFDYDVQTGHIFFRMTNSYIDSQLGNDLFSYMLYCACQTIDEYNDKFLMISKGMLTLEKFVETENN